MVGSQLNIAHPSGSQPYDHIIKHISRESNAGQLDYNYINLSPIYSFDHKYRLHYTVLPLMQFPFHAE